ncbi:MAG: hypothetical protein IK028_05080 [Bacilli bacterium]|nr:hypothetical protein [Bacilli bacterium]
MRRLWSHIVIAATSLLMVGATFATVVTNINSNIEFEKGQELTFRITAKDDDGNPDKDYEFTTDEAVKETAEIMEKRLATADISRYKVETAGFDTIKVSFVQDTAQEYEIIQNYLSFNATLAISNSKETYALATEFLDANKKAYLEIENGYPTIVIPIKADNELFQAVYTEAKEMSDNNTGEVEEQHEHSDDEEETEVTRHAYLYLWYDYIEDYYSYDKINQNSSDTYNQAIADKVLMTFDAANPFVDDEQTALRAYVNPKTDDNNEVTPESLKQAFKNARYYVNLLNAGQMEYHVDFMFSKTADLFVESLVNLGEHQTLAWSRTFIATIVAIAVISLLLVYFYRLGASGIAVTSIVSTFIGLLLVVALGAEYNIAGMVGLIALGLISVLSGVIYMNKFKEECYRGRTLKKANSEAAKKSLLPIVDLHAVLVAMGVACYLLGGVMMKSFAVATILGGLSSLLLNLLFLRGMQWLVTNEQGLAGRYDLFDVAADQVADGLDENKARYEGANADKDYTKHKKPIGIASIVLFIASVTCMLVFGISQKGAIYSSDSKYGNSQVYIEYTSEVANNTSLTADVKDRIDSIINNSTLDGTPLKEITELETYEYVAKYDTNKGGTSTIYYAYYRINFDKALSGNEMLKYNDLTPIAVKDFFTLDELNNASGANLKVPANVSVSLKDSVRINADQPSVASLIAATSVGIGISALYLLLRYRLSRGLASLIVSTVATGISAGLFAMLRFLPVTSYAGIAIPFIAIFTLAIGIIFMNKEREMVLEDRNRDNSIEARNTLMVKATALSSTPITIAFIMALYLGVNFFGFMFTNISYIFLAVILGVSIATALTLVCFGPLAQVFFKAFSGVKIIKPKAKKKKARPVRVNKSAEPEEAIFIGIND